MKNRYIDFHAHILPGADHGSKGIEVSLRQLSMAKEAGIGIIVATAHFYPHRESSKLFLDRREKAFAEISAYVSDEIEIICAAEVLLCEGMQNLPDLKKLKIGESNTILIEMPEPPWSNRLYETLNKIRNDCGLQIVIAHVERYDPDDVEWLFSLGHHGQLNASAFHRLFGRKKYYKWIEEGYVTALGSDIHGLDEAYKDYTHAMQHLGRRGEMLQRSMREITVNK